MGAGQTGVGGRPAASPVELVSRNVLEAAHDQRRNLVENHAWEKYWKLMSATIIHAQVRPGDINFTEGHKLFARYATDGSHSSPLYICYTSKVSLCTYVQNYS